MEQNTELGLTNLIFNSNIYKYNFFFCVGIKSTYLLDILDVYQLRHDSVTSRYCLIFLTKHKEFTYLMVSITKVRN